MMKKAVLLVNLGTPDAPEVPAVGRYLRQFLNDHRVIDISAIGRFFLVNFIIIPFRVRKSTRLYQSIWTKDGSPLLAYGKQLTSEVRSKLPDHYHVELAMRYGNPSISEALKKLRKVKPESLLIVPLYPQYAASTSASVFDDVFNELRKWEIIPALKTISRFYDDPGFLQAWKSVASSYDFSKYDHILFSYHGLPERQVLKASREIEANCCLTPGCCDSINDKNSHCYRANCYDTTRKMIATLNLPQEKTSICFQSRLGNDEWLKPYAEDVIRELAASGKKRVLVFAPAFVADCLETIEEIGEEYRHLFTSIGGEQFDMVPSLNAHPAWVRALTGIIRKETTATTT